MHSSSFPLSFEAMAALIAQGSASIGVYSSPQLLPPSFPSWPQAVNEMLESALTAGVLDPLRPATEEGEGILVLAERSMGPLGEGLSQEVLIRAAGVAGALGPTVNGQSALIQALPCLFDRDPYTRASGGVDRLARWFRASSKQEITAIDPPQGPEGAGVLSCMIEKVKGASSMSVDDWRHLIRALRDSGVEWAHPGIAQQKRVPPKLVEALCEEGLDLLASWNGTPAWKGLLERGLPSIVTIVERRMESVTSPGSDKAQQEVAISTYLAGFSSLTDSRRSKRGAGEAERKRREVLSHLCSRPDWHQVADASGRSAFFHAVLANPGILRHVLERMKSAPGEERRQWQQALGHRDHKGRNLWFYLYGHQDNSTLTPSLIYQVAQVVPDAKDSNGNGMAVQLLLDIPEALRALALPGEGPLMERQKPLPPSPWPFSLQDWHQSEAQVRTKALDQAMAHPQASYDLVSQLPITNQTAFYKVLSLMLYSPRYCQPGQAFHNSLTRAIERMKSFPEESLSIPHEILQPSREKILDTVSGDKYLTEVLDDLERLALRNSMGAALPSAAPVRRRQARL